MSSVIEHYPLKMTEDDNVFFQALGQRIATLRKAQNMTHINRKYYHAKR